MGAGKRKLKENTQGCIFCKKTTKDELDYGGLKLTKSLSVHYYCLLLSKSIKQLGEDNQGILGFMPKDIVDEFRASFYKQCCYCKKFNATLGCAYKKCSRYYHLPCAISKNVQSDFNNFTTYCHTHRKQSNIPVFIKKSLTTYHCIICFEVFTKNTNIFSLIWADCCKSNIIFHTNCMKQLALNAGYFTKCPGCNNTETFNTTIKSFGVFVPERDASWELERNAFSELMYVHNACDIQNCLCPQGRNYSSKKNKWKLILCKLCGSFGTHLACSNFKKEFICEICNIDKRKEEVSDNTKTCEDLDKNMYIDVVGDNTDDNIDNIEKQKDNLNASCSTYKDNDTENLSILCNVGFDNEKHESSYHIVDDLIKSVDTTTIMPQTSTQIMQENIFNYNILLDTDSEIEFISLSKVNTNISNSSSNKSNGLGKHTSYIKRISNLKSNIQVRTESNQHIHNEFNRNKKIIKLNFGNYFPNQSLYDRYRWI